MPLVPLAGIPFRLRVKVETGGPTWCRLFEFKILAFYTGSEVEFKLEYEGIDYGCLQWEYDLL